MFIYLRVRVFLATVGFLGFYHPARCVRIGFPVRKYEHGRRWPVGHPEFCARPCVPCLWVRGFQMVWIGADRRGWANHWHLGSWVSSGICWYISYVIASYSFTLSLLSLTYFGMTISIIRLWTALRSTLYTASAAWVLHAACATSFTTTSH